MVAAMKSAARLPLFVLAVSVAALAFALTAEYGFGLKPCVLCLVQRVPFVLAGLAAGLVLALPRLGRWVMPLVVLTFLVNSGIAFYHVGVEQKWWASACSGSAVQAVDVTDLAAMMSKPAEAQCDEPAWQWHGITMAALNVPFSAAMGLMALAALVRRKDGR
ncbi:putative disulfide bond formation protein DsbB [Magnetospirillum sp. LM-5]|nr:putative disulfide bond formation protein DsbB [Magnetospirillum sp. LM-5]